jgi:predicted metalloprotease with PDZ domain
MVNLDMVGRLRSEGGKDVLQVHGTGTSKGFNALIDRLNHSLGFRLNKIAGGLGPSDHSSFYSSKVPVFFFFTGNHKDYHRPSDTADKINVPGMARVADLVESLVQSLATTTDRPRYVYVKGGFSVGRPYAGPTLGIMPGNYNDEVPGLLVGGVRENGPADKAGMKEGDRIIEIGGKPVKNIQTYMVILRTHKRGQPVEVTVLRKGKKVVLKATPR